MAIDADLNAGLITEQEAIERRKEVQRNADFYGAMDGASKFVKGDAIAGIIITIIKITGMETKAPINIFLFINPPKALIYYYNISFIRILFLF